MIKFTINIEPTAQMRPRSRAIKVKWRTMAMAYKDPKQLRREEQFMPLLAQHCPETPLTGALKIEIDIFLPTPASKPSWWQSAAVAHFILPAKRPDVDNYVKHALDCMQVVGYFKDDAQIFWVKAKKLYGSKPRWEFSIKEFPQPSSKKEYEAMMAGKGYVEQTGTFNDKEAE